jgi:hypothetical protein
VRSLDEGVKGVLAPAAPPVLLLPRIIRESLSHTSTGTHAGNIVMMVYGSGMGSDAGMEEVETPVL